jgi:hypothetical protein
MMKKFRDLVNDLELLENKKEIIESMVSKKNEKLNQELMNDNISEDRAIEIIEMTTQNELDLGLIEINIEIHNLENEVIKEFLNVINNFEDTTKEEIEYINSIKNLKHSNGQRQIITLAKNFNFVMM